MAFTPALTNGTVTDAPLVLAEAPRYESSLACGPTVSVLAQPTPKKAAAAITNVTFTVFMIKIIAFFRQLRLTHHDKIELYNVTPYFKKESIHNANGQLSLGGVELENVSDSSTYSPTSIN